MSVKHATIYHNSRCGTSRAVLALLEEAGMEVTVVDYLKNPLSADELRELLALMNVGVRDVIRTKESIYTELGLDRPHLNEDTLLTMLEENPVLLNRPIVVTAVGAALCRPAESVHALLPVNR